MENAKYQPVIGLEIHIELATKSKMFCPCSASHFEAEPNSLCCPVCLGMPGALPVPNKKAIDWAIMLGLALNCQANKESKFDRKNYFYPDLPKGYQISQYDAPLCKNGYSEIKSKTENQNAFKSQFSSTNFQSNSKFQFSNTKKIRIRRVHLEEDTAKLIHTEVEGEKACLIDFNRSGVPLAEVVTEPDFEETAQVNEFLKKLQLIVRYLGISLADMEKGSMRLEPNISVRKQGQNELPSYKVEVKNINSFRFVRKAIDFEIKRQTELLEKGQKPLQENRGWNEAKGETVSQREKEEAHDYRYFPEPDIPPMVFDEISIRQLTDQIPELPDEKIKRFVSEYKISEYNAEILCQEKFLADYFESTVKIGKENSFSPAQVANWLINRKVDINKITPEQLIKTIAQSQQMFEISDEDLEKAVAKVIAENPKAVEDYKKGKTQVLGFLIGKVVSITNPSIDKKLVQEKLTEILTKNGK